MTDKELYQDSRLLEIQRNKNILRMEFSASLLNATPETQQWIERQINRVAFDRYSQTDEYRRKLST